MGKIKEKAGAMINEDSGKLSRKEYLKAYMAAYNKKYREDPDIKEAIRLRAKARAQDPDVKKKRQEYLRAKNALPEQKELARQRVLKYRSKEENRIREKERNKTYTISDDRKAKNAEWARIKRVEDIEWAEKQREAGRARMKEYYKRDDVKERAREYRQRPDIKERIRRRISSDPIAILKRKEKWAAWYGNEDNAAKVRAKAKERAAIPEVRNKILQRVAMIGGTSAVHRARHYGCVIENVDRMVVFERDGWLCCDCGISVVLCSKYRPDRATIDHTIPLSKGGPHSMSNVRTLCFICNSKKRDRLIGEYKVEASVKGMRALPTIQQQTA